MASSPLIDARTADAVGAGLIPPGPELTAGEAAEVVAGLRAASLASVGPVADVTGLGATADGPMLVVDRPAWLRANVEMTLTMLAEASGASEPATAWERAEARVNGAQLGGVLAVLGTRILGQYLPFSATPSLLLVAPNVAHVERELGVRPADFRLWVCLHEQTHRLQFARAPWLRGHLIAEMAALLDAGDAADEGVPGRGRRRPGSLLDLVTTPHQQRVITRVTAAMSLLEGYADDMMDRVGPSIVPSVTDIRARFERRRRQRGGWTAVLNKVLSLDLKLAQYRDGARFCRAVIDRVGVDGLNAVYEAPARLPTPEEIADPPRWVARVHG